MKVLLDECLPLDFSHHFPGHEVHTAEWAGFKSLKNGRLIHEAEGAESQVFLTVDQGVPHQQNLSQRKISILVIRSKTNQMEHLLPIVDAILHVLETILPGEVVFVS